MLKRLLLIAVFGFTVMLSNAQLYPTPILHLNANNPLDTLPNDSVLISEVYLPIWGTWGFLEITNHSSRVVHLSHYFLQGRYPFRTDPFIGNDNKVNLRGELAPGKCYIATFPDLNYSLDAYGKPSYDKYYTGPRDLNAIADTVYALQGSMRYRQFSMYNRFINNAKGGIVDSVIVDVFNTQANDAASNKPVAGISTGNIPAATMYWVRKTNVRKGTSVLGQANAVAYWDKIRGTSTIDSEWLPVPNDYLTYYNAKIFTSVKSFGTSTLSNIKSAGRVTVNLDAKTIKFPYNVSRDSVFREFNCGPNVTWHFKIGPDTAKYFVQNNDTIIFYLFSDALTEVKFVAQVDPEPANSVEVSPLVYFNANRAAVKKWVVSQGKLPMDTIGNVGYETRVDTLVKYLVFPAGSSYEIIPPDGIQSPDLKRGSILKVISADKKSEKQYLVGTNPYVPNHDASIARVIFPELYLWENSSYLPTDTFMTFNSKNTSYVISLPADITVSPAIIPVPTNKNTRFEIQRAKNLKGSLADRTMNILSIAEDDTTRLTYSITFRLEHEAPQLDYSPFVCDLGTDWAVTNNYMTQLFNPSDEQLDMTEYVLVNMKKGTYGSLSAMSDLASNDWIKYDKFILRPGFLVVNNSEGKPVYSDDLSQTSLIVRPKSCFSICNYRCYPMEGTGSSKELAERIDFLVYQNFNASGVFGKPYDKWGFGWTYGLFGSYTPTSFNNGGSIVLFKIKSDSVRDGIKAMNDFVNDYSVVDVINGVGNVGGEWKIYDKVNGKDMVYLPPNANKWNMYRKSNVYKGNPNDLASFGFGNDTAVVQPGEWNIYGYPGANIKLSGLDSPNAMAEMMTVSRTRFKNHSINITEHIAYILSEVYDISGGIEGEQTIIGVPANTMVSSFMSNLILLDPKLTVEVKSSGGTVKTAGEVIADGDIVYTTSARGTDHITYKVSFAPLSSDALLTSTVYTIAKTGSTGKISNVPFGITLVDFMKNIKSNVLARVTPLDAVNNIIPSLALPTDTTKIKNGERVNKLLGAGTKVEVKAQNGDICLYTVEFSNVSTPFVISDVFSVNEPGKTIDNAIVTSVSAFLANLKTAPGFKIKVVNKLDQDRKDGTLRYDDKVVVYQESNMANASTYYINVINEDTHDAIAVNKSAASAIVYPNPTSGNILVKAKGLNKVTVSDITGRLIFSKQSSANEMTIKLPAAGGIYLVGIHGENGSETVKVLKQ